MKKEKPLLRLISQLMSNDPAVMLHPAVNPDFMKKVTGRFQIPITLLDEHPVDALFHILQQVLAKQFITLFLESRDKNLSILSGFVGLYFESSPQTIIQILG